MRSTYFCKPDSLFAGCILSMSLAPIFVLSKENISMKVLVLTPNFPSPTWGAGTRNYYLLKTLARHHAVSLLSLIDCEEDLEKRALLQDVVTSIKCIMRPSFQRKRLRQLSCMARLQSYSLALNEYVEVQAALDELLAKNNYDAVLFESVLISRYRLPATVKRIVDQHNIEYELFWRTYRNESAGWRKWYNWCESRLLKPDEIALCRKADLVLTTSERDQATLQRFLPSTNVEVVPNGVDIEVFQHHSVNQISDQIIFTGAMNYYPNIDAVLSFASNCWPLVRAQIPSATWLIVGREPPLEVRRLGELLGVTVTGGVPDVRAYLASSAVALAPLRVGGGTRLKILEAFAMGKAVVSTSMGCEGLCAVPEEHLLVADHPELFARAVVQLLQDGEMRVRLGRAGRELVEEKYSWECCGAQLLRVLEMYGPERKQACL